MTDKPNEYVLGFLFEEEDLNHEFVVMIKKKKPIWQKDKLNGIGGHIKEGETPSQAMIREFSEETGVSVCNWAQFAFLTYHNGDKVWCFVTADTLALNMARTQDGENAEEIHSTSRTFLRDRAKVLPNINWLIEMARAYLKYPGEPVLSITYPQT